MHNIQNDVAYTRFTPHAISNTYVNAAYNALLLCIDAGRMRAEFFMMSFCASRAHKVNARSQFKNNRTTLTASQYHYQL